MKFQEERESRPFLYIGIGCQYILAGKRYGGITGTAVNRVVPRFKERLSRDKKLREKMEHILSFDEM